MVFVKMEFVYVKLDTVVLNAKLEFVQMVVQEMEFVLLK
jgi:hypothetical protein